MSISGQRNSLRKSSSSIDRIQKSISGLREGLLNIRKKQFFGKSYPNLRKDDLVRVDINKKAISKGHHPKFFE